MLKIEPVCDSAIPLLCSYPKNFISYRDIYSYLLLHYSQPTRKWRRHRCPRADGWLVKMEYRCAMEFFLAVKVSPIMKLARKRMELGTSLSEVMVSERQSPRVLSYICALVPTYCSQRALCAVSMWRDKKLSKQDRPWTLLEFAHQNKRKRPHCWRHRFPVATKAAASLKEQPESYCWGLDKWTRCAHQSATLMSMELPVDQCCCQRCWRSVFKEL